MRRSGYLLVTGCMLALGSHVPFVSAQPAPAPTERVAASLNCGSHSSNPKLLKAFQADLQFDLYGSLWMLDRKTGPQSGEEKFRGILSPTGMMLIAGQGKSDAGETWTYEFSGSKNPKGVTILKGSLRSDQPKGTRTCSLTF